MSSEITMSVSMMTRNKDNKAIYVLFTDRDKSAEFSLPGINLISNIGFDIKEIDELKIYIDNEQDMIFKMAGEINPIKSMLGKM